MKLTQCLIVKNEKRNLERCINWGKGVVDELVVVDTGSQDGTAALAEKLGAKVFHFKWTFDFSAARNYAISRCRGDWIIFLDADEYFEKEDVPLLRPLIEKADTGAFSENGESKRYNVIQLPWINNGTVSRQARIFKNDPYIRYSGVLHEQLQALPGGCLRVYDAQERPAIRHTGYDWSDYNTKKAKATRNFEIAEKALSKNPGCAKLRLFAAEALSDGGRYKEAENYFSKALQNGDGSILPERLREGYKQQLNNYLCFDFSSSNTAGLLESAARSCFEAVKKFPDDPDYDILLSMICFKAKDIRNAARLFNTSLSKSGGRISQSLAGASGETLQKLKEACEALKNLGVI